MTGVLVEGRDVDIPRKLTLSIVDLTITGSLGIGPPLAVQWTLYLGPSNNSSAKLRNYVTASLGFSSWLPGTLV